MSFEVGGSGGNGGTGISEADAIALIEARYRVIDGTPGNIPDADADQLLKLAPDNRGNVRTLVEIPHHAIARSGDFSLYGPAHFRGSFYYAPFSGTDVQDVYYSTSHKYFARVTLIGPNNYQWRATSILDALGSGAEWLGQVPNQEQALAAIEDFDSTKAYYTYTATDQNVMVLDNSTYIGGQDEDVTHEWQNIVGDSRERLALLESKSYYWGHQQTGRLEGQRQIGALRSRLRWNPTAQENIHAGVQGVTFLASGDVSADADSLVQTQGQAAVAIQDNQFFKLPAGRWDISCYVETQARRDLDLGGRLMKVQSGDDDSIIHRSSGYSGRWDDALTEVSTQTDTSVGQTLEIDVPDLKVAADDEFYFVVLGLSAGEASAVRYYMKLRRTSL